MIGIMSYLEFLDSELSISRKKKKGRVLDLFAGAGGLALGFEAVGFETVGYEMDPDACATYNKNLNGSCHSVFLNENTEYAGDFDVIIGGPPCQPFSVIGRQKGKADERNGFPAFISAVKAKNPKIVVFENVRGMLYKNKEYFEFILSELRNLNYVVEFKLLNSSHYGVPQKRERLFVIGHRSIWSFPKQFDFTFTAGDAVNDLLKKLPSNPKFLTKSMDEYVAKYEKASSCIRPRDLHLDQPSRTVTCRNLNGATGDMLRVKLKDGRRRRLTVREGARLQSFPDWFDFCGTEGSQFNQVGNAVPPLLSKAIASQVLRCLSEPKGLNIKEIAEKNQPDQLALFV